jgi:hypothetical protein
VKKTSIYLDDVDRERLCRLAEREGKSQAFIVREALALYDTSRPDKNFEIFKMALEPGALGFPHFDDPQDFQDWIDTEGLKGMGEDSFWDAPPR